MTKTTTIPPVISADELAVMLAERPDIRLLDVRTPGEFATVHLHGAYNVPLDTLPEHAAQIRATVTNPIVLLCRSARRASQAARLLQSAGMSQLHILDGGLDSWLAAGHPVERGPARLPLERQVRVVAGALAAVGGLLALTVHRRFAVLPSLVGSGLVFAGLTDTCGMAMLLAKLPYNQPTTCDVDAMVQALKDGVAPPVTTEAPAGGSCR